ncbi:alpha/beta hydrolase [Solirubrobacter sp. CPCC 204708]|uniref:Alpha/beta hydrolase n=1 Tax=Solirubrobacter deserti TaxID=2282478 RepID=A0ABT4RGP3_9ACTN|nr:alpha/beta hydrolase [Solirubrobacter deserti]MBE2319719.1 alpha/beta hydrolase [Solirubrobacter deserti]MDA0137541.1 alpha/beta hydrolase [Solirubrobacter deserti]
MSASRRNNVHITGNPDGRPMVFAHGFGCDQGMWRRVAPAFEATHRVVLFDHVGSGGSDASGFSPARYASLTAYARDIVEFCVELDLTDIVFVGHSVSAMIGVLASNLAPERFASLVLIGPSPRYIDDEGYVGGFTREDIDGLLENMETDYLGWSSVMAPAIMGRPDAPDLGEELTASFCRSDQTIARHFARVTFTSDNRADLPRTTTPALVLQCQDDVIASIPVGEYVHAQLPDSTFVLLDASGHCPHLSAPAETIDAIRAFSPAAATV